MACFFPRLTGVIAAFSRIRKHLSDRIQWSQIKKFMQGSKGIGLFFAESSSLAVTLLKIYGKNTHDSN